MNVYDRKMKNVNELRIIGISPPPCGRPSSQGWKQASPAQPGRVLLLSGAASAKAWRRQAALHGRHEPASSRGMRSGDASGKHRAGLFQLMERSRLGMKKDGGLRQWWLVRHLEPVRRCGRP